VSQRKQRVEHGLRDVLTEMVAREVRDPRVRAATLITITRVELNVDLSVAMVYVSIVGGDAPGVLAGLAKAAGFLRGPVGRKLNLQHAPELRFVADASIDMSEKLAAIVRDDEERARAAGREVGDSTRPRPPAPDTPDAPDSAAADAPDSAAADAPDPAHRDEPAHREEPA
jgi:ribosome-binding factor A